MAEDQTFFQGHGKLPKGPRSEPPVSVPCQHTLMEKPDCDWETWHIRFRTFSSSEESDPVQDLKRLCELCHQWLRPDLHTKEQMMDELVLEQFMICMLLECQVLVKESGVQSCKDMEDMLRNNQKPRKWTTVRIQGDEYLVRSLDIETFEVELSDTNDEKDLPRDPQSLVSEIPPKNGQQDQKGLLPEIIPETGELEGLTPKENLEKDLMEDMEETRTRQSQELELPKHREEEGATYLDKGHFSGQFGSHSVVSPSTVGPTSPPEGKEAKGRAPYCRVCKKRFPYQSQVILHQRTHTGERPFRCNICAEGSMQSSDLTHERIHTGEKPYCCDLCPKKLTHNSTLRAHKRTHTKEKPFRYEHCDKAFSHRWNLKVHRCTHSGLKPYMCPECHSTFRQLGSFKRHQKTHSK
ncbi:LOW QUALITY PROTEIN: zinc finger and SCAN domain-containing protein 5B-like [Megaptera novaeangliae]